MLRTPKCMFNFIYENTHKSSYSFASTLLLCENDPQNTIVMAKIHANNIDFTSSQRNENAPGIYKFTKGRSCKSMLPEYSTYKYIFTYYKLHINSNAYYSSPDEA